MKDKELQFDRTCHVLYSKPCKKQIRSKIALHYPVAERETVWERVQRQYVTYLSDWRTDLGGSKNFHNGVGGTYDCIALMSYYSVCKAVTTCADGCKCDYTICGDRDEYLKEHPEYVDKQGFRRNK